jgi:hypothetical protein
MPDWVKQVLDDWFNVAALTSDGIFRRVNTAGKSVDDLAVVGSALLRTALSEAVFIWFVVCADTPYLKTPAPCGAS